MASVRIREVVACPGWRGHDPGQDLDRSLMPNQAVVYFELQREGSGSSSSLPALPVHHRGHELESIGKGTSWTFWG